MSRQNRLDPILHHAETQQQDAAKRLSNLLQQQRAAEQQLQQLTSYRKEYAAVQLNGAGQSIEELQNHQTFIVQLGKAIEQQEMVLIQLQRQVEQHKTYWQQAKTRCDALSGLIDKQALKALQKENYREQKETDELSSRKSMPRLA